MINSVCQKAKTNDANGRIMVNPKGKKLVTDSWPYQLKAIMPGA